MKALPRRAADLSSSGLGSVCTAVARWQSPPEAVQPLLSALAKSVGMLEPREVDAQLCFRGYMLDIDGHSSFLNCGVKDRRDVGKESGDLGGELNRLFMIVLIYRLSQYFQRP